MDIEINDTHPDFKCKECDCGLEVFTENDYEGDIDVICPKCKYKNVVRRVIYYNYKVL